MKLDARNDQFSNPCPGPRSDFLITSSTLPSSLDRQHFHSFRVLVFDLNACCILELRGRRGAITLQSDSNHGLRRSFKACNGRLVAGHVRQKSLFGVGEILLEHPGYGTC